MRSSAAKIQIASFDDLFQPDGAGQQTAAEQVQDIPLEKLVSFRNHPFQVRDDEEMQKTVESVAHYGVLVPAIARPADGGRYELISGHRRKRASELAGKSTMPVIVRTLDDDEATIIMVDANLQRERLLPSEKAFAYKMKLEAMKHQGKRNDLTSERAVLKLNARDRIAQDAGEKSGMAVARYISLTKLISPLLRMVDEERFSVSMAADYISSLAQAEQEHLSVWMSQTGRVPTQSQLKQLKQLKQNSQEGTLDDETMDTILTERSEEPLRMTIRKDKLQRFFPAAYTMAQMEEVIFSLLESWHTQNG